MLGGGSKVGGGEKLRLYLGVLVKDYYQRLPAKVPGTWR